MVISIGVDSTAIPSPHKLCDAIEDSLKATKAALSERGSVKAPPLTDVYMSLQNKLGRKKEQWDGILI